MAIKQKILVVDHHDDERQTLVDQLSVYDHFDVSEAAKGTEVLEKVKDTVFDTILMETVLPDMDGREVCKLLRRDGVTAPVIMLTEANTDADTILSLDSGANDHVAKPFNIGVLLARVRAQLRQYEQSEDVTFTIGDYIYRPSNRTLTDQERDVTVQLSDIENSILKYLCRSPDQIVSSRDLYGEVWGMTSKLDTHTLQTHIYRLRRKIEPAPSKPRYLISESNGYRLLR